MDIDLTPVEHGSFLVNMWLNDVLWQGEVTEEGCDPYELREMIDDALVAPHKRAYDGEIVSIEEGNYRAYVFDLSRANFASFDLIRQGTRRELYGWGEGRLLPSKELKREYLSAKSPRRHVRFSEGGGRWMATTTARYVDEAWYILASETEKGNLGLSAYCTTYKYDPVHFRLHVVTANASMALALRSRLKSALPYEEFKHCECENGEEMYFSSPALPEVLKPAGAIWRAPQKRRSRRE